MQIWMQTQVNGYHEVSVEGARYKGNTQKTPDYFKTMDLDVKNIDIKDKNKWVNIYMGIYSPYFGDVKLFPKKLLIPVKIMQMIHKTFQLK